MPQELLQEERYALLRGHKSFRLVNGSELAVRALFDEMHVAMLKDSPHLQPSSKSSTANFCSHLSGTNFLNGFLADRADSEQRKSTVL